MSASKDRIRTQRLRAFTGDAPPTLGLLRSDAGELTRDAKPRRYQYVVDEVQRQIRDGEIAAGDYLLPERQLAERLGVGRAVVREGLTALASRGIVGFAPGGGAYVRKSGISDLFTPLLSSTLFATEGVAHLLEVRKVLEAEAARLAAQRADEGQIAAIEGDVQQFDRAVASGQSTDLPDADFHLDVAEASGNPLLAQVMVAIFDVLGETYAQSRHRLTSTQDQGGVFVSKHRDIFEAIRDRDPERARTAMYVHLAYAERELGSAL